MAAHTQVNACHPRSTMTTPHSIAFLSAERDKAKASLESSPAWAAWKSAMTAVVSLPEMPVLSVLGPTPEDVLQLTNGFEPWDVQDPVVAEHRRVQQLLMEKSRVNKLRQRVEEGEEWQTLVRVNRQLKAQLFEETTQLRQSLLVIDTIDRPLRTPFVTKNDAAPNKEASHAAAPQPSAAEHPSNTSTNGTADRAPAAPTSPASSPTLPSRSPSPFKRDESTKLMVPSWCSGVVPDLYQTVPEYGLGLVDAEVYQGMCGSVRTQVQRLWSTREGGHNLLAALLRAVEFQLDTHYEPPSRARVDELRDSMLKKAAAWSDEELSVVVPAYDPKATSEEQFLKVCRTSSGYDDALPISRAAPYCTPNLCHCCWAPC